MKKLIIVGIILIVICLIPIKISYKDGGTVEYKALVYNVIFMHSISGSNYNEGVIVKVLGFEVFDNVKYHDDSDNIDDGNVGDTILEIYVKIKDKVLTVYLTNNSSSDAFVEKLKEKDITLNLHDYGNFEKVGDLGFDLPRNDQKIKTVPGDIILYLGNQITIYYDTNTWEFTKIGRIQDISNDELKELLGEGDVTVTFSLNKI